jgi:hypothetical protein
MKTGLSAHFAAVFSLRSASWLSEQLVAEHVDVFSSCSSLRVFNIWRRDYVASFYFSSIHFQDLQFKAGLAVEMFFFKRSWLTNSKKRSTCRIHQARKKRAFYGFLAENGVQIPWQELYFFLKFKRPT